MCELCYAMYNYIAKYTFLQIKAEWGFYVNTDMCEIRSTLHYFLTSEWRFCVKTDISEFVKNY